MLTRAEASRLVDSSKGGLYALFRRCALAVLNSGSSLDDGQALLERYPSFDVRVIHDEHGIQLALTDAPAESFVDGVIIEGIREHLFSVARDILFVNEQVESNPQFDLGSSTGITDAVFHILRNARVLQPGKDPRLVVCWGGHAIPRWEYDYSKDVGYQLGLRGLDIGTGCGPGAMKGPMKGAAIGHAKQRITDGQYLGVTEPGIIAAEAPNPIVNALVILPDIEKRLEAFVRMAHGIIVLPGGAGTTEEILYLLGVLLHPRNVEVPYPLIFTGPPSAKRYFEQIDTFIGATLGEDARARYQIIIDNPVEVARVMHAGIQRVQDFRDRKDEAFYFNWSLTIAEDFQQPFEPTHSNMAALNLHRDQSSHELAVQLRRAFSGVVAGNVKADGIRAVRAHGPFELHGDPAVMQPMDQLLTAFVEQQRMKLPGAHYEPCYRFVR